MVVIKILKADPSMWYHSCVGRYVPYVRTVSREGIHLSREHAGYTNIVKIEDSQLAEVAEHFSNFY